MNLFVKGFKKGSWLSKANSLLGDKSKVAALLASLAPYMQKGGLQKIQSQLKLLSGYVSDIIHGRYKDYSTSALLLAVGAILYVVSPLDIVPDVLVGLGFIDDVAIVTWAISQLNKELAKYESHTRLQ